MIDEAKGYLFKMSEVEAFGQQHGLPSVEAFKGKHGSVVEGKGARNTLLENTERQDTNKAISRKGGKHEKKNVVLIAAIHHAFKDRPDLKEKPASSTLRYLKRNTLTISKGKLKGKLYVDDGKIETEFKGKTKPVARSTFDRYVSEIKKNIRQSLPNKNIRQ